MRLSRHARAALVAKLRLASMRLNRLATSLEEADAGIEWVWTDQYFDAVKEVESTATLYKLWGDESKNT